MEQPLVCPVPARTRLAMAPALAADVATVTFVAVAVAALDLALVVVRALPNRPLDSLLEGPILLKNYTLPKNKLWNSDVVNKTLYKLASLLQGQRPRQLRQFRLWAGAS